MGSSTSDDFSVVVLASDLGVDARSFLSAAEQENWHDCSSDLPPADDQNLDFSDLDALNFFRLDGGSDKSGNRIFRIVGKYFPVIKESEQLVDEWVDLLSSEKVRFVKERGSYLFQGLGVKLYETMTPVVAGERLKKYVFYKILKEMPEGPFCIVYMHSTVQKEDNSPGLTMLRWIYEELPNDYKDRLQVVYFIHPGLRSRLVFATLGRFLLSGGLYWKIKYVSRLQYLWQDIKKGQVEIPEIVQEHDDILEHRPLTDYGIEPDPMHLMEIPYTAYSHGRYEKEWSSRECRS